MYTVGDFLIRLKNAYLARKRDVVFPYSRVAEAISKILVEEGFIKKVEETSEDNKRMLVVQLLYKKGKASLSDVRLLSKPSIQLYANKIRVKMGLREPGIGIISTSSGIMTDKKAHEKGVGGKLICRVY